MIAGFVVMVLAIIGLCYHIHRREKYTERLLEIWLKNEKIVQLLEKGNINDFIYESQVEKGKWKLDNFSFYPKLLKEYVNDDDNFDEFAVFILQRYYSNESVKNTEKKYREFKNQIENN